MINLILLVLMSSNVNAAECCCVKKPVVAKVVQKVKREVSRSPSVVIERQLVKKYYITQVAAPVVQPKQETKTVVVEKRVVQQVMVRKMNKISILGGYGPQGVDAYRTSSSSIEAKQQYNVIGGLGYSRRLDAQSDTLLGVQALSNKSAALVLDLEF